MVIRHRDKFVLILPTFSTPSLPQMLVSISITCSIYEWYILNEWIIHDNHHLYDTHSLFAFGHPQPLSITSPSNTTGWAAGGWAGWVFRFLGWWSTAKKCTMRWEQQRVVNCAYIEGRLRSMGESDLQPYTHITNAIPNQNIPALRPTPLSRTLNPKILTLKPTP